MKFTVIIPPKAQMRARSRAIKTKAGKTISMQYKAGEQRLEEDKLITLMYQHRPHEPLQGPLLLGVRAYLPIPKSKPKKWQAAALAGEIRPTTKPDGSNILKNLEDVMQGVFFIDDKQIVVIYIEKLYGEPSRYEIEIEEVHHGKEAPGFDREAICKPESPGDDRQGQARQRSLGM